MALDQKNISEQVNARAAEVPAPHPAVPAPASVSAHAPGLPPAPAPAPAPIATEFEKEEAEIIYQRKPKTVIVGMGIAGLYTAIQLAEKEHDIILIENRTEFTRHQKIFLSRTVIENLLIKSELKDKVDIKFSSDDSTFSFVGSTPPGLSEMSKNLDLQPLLLFFENLAKNQCIISIKGLQEFLELLLHIKIARLAIPKVSTESDKKFFSEYQLQRAFTEELQNIAIFKGDQFEITALDGNEQSLTLLDKQKNTSTVFQFDYLVAADGKRRAMVELLKVSNPKKYTIQFDPLPKPRQKEYGVCVLKLAKNFHLTKEKKRNVISNKKETSSLTLKHLGELMKLGWDKPYLPLYYVAFSEEYGNEFYLTGEVPLSIKEEGLQNWAKKLLSIEYGFPEEAFIFEVSNLTSMFNLEPSIAQKNILPLGKKGGFFLIGDSMLPANFLFGHGVSDAIDDSLSLSNCFDEPDPDQRKFLCTLPLRDQLKNRKKAYELENDYFNEMLKVHGVDIPNEDPKIKKALTLLVEFKKDAMIAIRTKDIEIRENLVLYLQQKQALFLKQQLLLQQRLFEDIVTKNHVKLAVFYSEQFLFFEQSYEKVMQARTRPLPPSKEDEESLECSRLIVDALLNQAVANSICPDNYSVGPGREGPGPDHRMSSAAIETQAAVTRLENKCKVS